MTARPIPHCKNRQARLHVGCRGDILFVSRGMHGQRPNDWVKQQNSTPCPSSSSPPAHCSSAGIPTRPFGCSWRCWRSPATPCTSGTSGFSVSGALRKSLLCWRVVGSSQSVDYTPLLGCCVSKCRLHFTTCFLRFVVSSCTYNMRLRFIMGEAYFRPRFIVGGAYFLSLRPL